MQNTIAMQYHLKTAQKKNRLKKSRNLAEDDGGTVGTRARAKHRGENKMKKKTGQKTTSQAYCCGRTYWD